MKRRIKFFDRNYRWAIALLWLPMLFSSCFTGIESTKKINLTREDRKLAAPTPEELLTSEIVSLPLKSWERGKRFIAADNKALLIIVPQRGLLPFAPDSIKGKILQFEGVESKVDAAGKLTVALLFSDGIYIYSYDTSKEFDDAMENVKSDRIPMLIDEDMVKQARNLLVGNNYWSKSPLWYDSEGNRVEGRKFEKVTIEDIEPGDSIFPLWVKIRSQNGNEAYVYMNLGNADNESRAFHNLFSLNDIRKQYSDIDDETWEYICRGKVKEGMTKEQCKLALGNPSDINSGHDYSQTLDIWVYDNGRVLWFEDGRLVKIRQ